MVAAAMPPQHSRNTLRVRAQTSRPRPVPAPTSRGADVEGAGADEGDVSLSITIRDIIRLRAALRQLLQLALLCICCVE